MLLRKVILQQSILSLRLFKLKTSFSTLESVVKTHYQVLEVPQSAGPVEIKRAYYRLAKQYHPDINQNGEEKFKELKFAYEILSDSNRRMLYDNVLNESNHKKVRSTREEESQKKQSDTSKFRSNRCRSHWNINTDYETVYWRNGGFMYNARGLNREKTIYRNKRTINNENIENSLIAFGTILILINLLKVFEKALNSPKKSVSHDENLTRILAGLIKLQAEKSVKNNVGKDAQDLIFKSKFKKRITKNK